jgi:hypothetical protein
MLSWNPSYGAERRIAWAMNAGGRGATATKVFVVDRYPRAMADARYTDACGPLQQPPRNADDLSNSTVGYSAYRNALKDGNEDPDNRAFVEVDEPILTRPCAKRRPLLYPKTAFSFLSGKEIQNEAMLTIKSHHTKNQRICRRKYWKSKALKPIGCDYFQWLLLISFAGKDRASVQQRGLI